MTKETFLTVRRNNLLTLALGLPTLVFGVIALSTSAMSDFWSFIGILILGVLYWTVVEQHSNMRFALLRKKSGNPIPSKLRLTHPFNLIYLAYNIIYWVPIILPLTGVIDYRAGFILFFIVIIIRGIANLVRNNVLLIEQAEKFPLRSP